MKKLSIALLMLIPALCLAIKSDSPYINPTSPTFTGTVTGLTGIFTNGKYNGRLFLGAGTTIGDGTSKLTLESGTGNIISSGTVTASAIVTPNLTATNLTIGATSFADINIAHAVNTNWLTVGSSAAFGGAIDTTGLSIHNAPYSRAATAHIYKGASGQTGNDTAALLIEDDTDVSMGIYCPIGNVGYYLFGNTQGTYRGGMAYGESTQELDFKSGGKYRLYMIGSSSQVVVDADGTKVYRSTFTQVGGLDLAGGLLANNSSEIKSSNYPPLRTIRTGMSLSSLAGVAAFQAQANNTGDLTAGYAGSIALEISSAPTGTVNTVGGLRWYRNGADNSGKIALDARSAGTAKEVFTGDSVNKQYTIGSDNAISTFTVNGLDLGGYVKPMSKTLAQLKVYSPGGAGEMWLCSDTNEVYVSTGTGQYAFVKVAKSNPD